MAKLLDIIKTAPKNKVEEECGRLVIGERIFRIRERLEKSQEEFGKILGWDADTVNRVEHGDFAEMPSDKFIQVIESVEHYKSGTYDESAICKVQPWQAPLFTTRKSGMFPSSHLACKTTKTQDA